MKPWIAIAVLSIAPSCALFPIVECEPYGRRIPSESVDQLAVGYTTFDAVCTSFGFPPWSIVEVGDTGDTQALWAWGDELFPDGTPKWDGAVVLEFDASGRLTNVVNRYM